MPRKPPKLTDAELCHRVRELDRLYLKWDTLLLQAEKEPHPHYVRQMRRAGRAYRQLRDTPYRA